MNERSFISLAAIALASLAAGCSTPMRDEPLGQTWNHDRALARAKQAIARANSRSVGEPLFPHADLDLDDRALLSKAEVRLDSVGWPIPGTSFVLPFMMMARGRKADGAIGIASGGFALGLAVDLLIFSPFGYRLHAVFVEVPEKGVDEDGNGFFAARKDHRVLFFDGDDRWFWNRDPIDDAAEAFEFLVREARSGGK